MKHLTLLIVLLCFSLALWAQPKLYIKIHGGMDLTNSVYRSEAKLKETIEGWHAGAALRLSYQRVFAEFSIDYYNSGIAVFLESTALATEELEKNEYRIRGMTLPFSYGWIAIRRPFFKWYFGTGPALRFNFNVKEIDSDSETKFKPREVSIHGTKLDWTFHTQFDVGWLNFKIQYLVGITNATRTAVRTNTNEFQFTAGLLF